MSAEPRRAPPPDAAPDSDLRRLVDNLPGMAYRCLNDADWTMLFVSAGSKALTGFSPTDLVANRLVAYSRLIAEEDRDRVWDVVQRAVHDGRDFTITYRIRRADGAERWVWEQGRGVEDERGVVRYVEGYIVDITGRYELATQLAEAETWTKILQDQPLVGVYVIEGRRFRFVNSRFASILGRSAEELLALPSVLATVHPSDRGRVAMGLDAARSGHDLAHPTRFRVIDGHGRTVHVEAHRSSVMLGDERVLVGVLIDVSDQVESERRAQHLQKMEAMSRLAAGIAHDFRNLLATIGVTAQLLQETGLESPEAREDLADIMDAVERARRLSEQLMELGVNRAAEARSLSLAESVKRMAPMLRKILGEEITLVEEADPDLPDVVVDHGHLEQILMNLVVNARDAMPRGRGGTVAVRARIGPAPPDGLPHICLEVSDDGPGVPADLRTRVFEPYFTTKEDKGTGLGLTNVWSIAQSYGGFVGLVSEPGQGATFSVYFPIPRR